MKLFNTASRGKNIVRVSFTLLILALLVAQFLPIGRNRINPPVLAEPPWDSPETRALFMNTCGDCHSNATRWPWYSAIAPASWLIERDVLQGRARFNVSEWGRKRNKSGDAVDELDSGEMPLRYYTLAHPSASLSDQEKMQLRRGLEATFGDGGQDSDRSGHDRDQGIQESRDH